MPMSLGRSRAFAYDPTKCTFLSEDQLSICVAFAQPRWTLDPLSWDPESEMRVAFRCCNFVEHCRIEPCVVTAL